MTARTDHHRNRGPCCHPTADRHQRTDAERGQRTITAATAASAEHAARHTDRPVPAGEFPMGDAFGEGYRTDGETPVHQVRLTGFRIDQHAVTNAQFSQFTIETGYRTEAEQSGSSAVFHLLARARPSDILGSAAGAPWWLAVRGADWAHPLGPRSEWTEVSDHPVVHVSHNDALAYCTWAGRRLPTEAEWEYAARGGLASARYAWGDDMPGPGHGHLMNIWQGVFPTSNTREDGHLGTCPVRSFPANGFGLYEMAGNIWEWCADWFSPHYYRNSPLTDPAGPAFGLGRVTRGGSYLCHASYCHRYRVAARTGNTPESGSGNCGFRTVALPETSCGGEQSRRYQTADPPPPQRTRRSLGRTSLGACPSH